MKTKKELDALKERVEELGNELRELNEEELSSVIGGVTLPDRILKQIVGIGGGGMIFTPTDDISGDTENNAR